MSFFPRDDQAGSSFLGIYSEYLSSTTYILGVRNRLRGGFFSEDSYVSFGNCIYPTKHQNSVAMSHTAR